MTHEVLMARGAVLLLGWTPVVACSWVILRRPYRLGLILLGRILLAAYVLISAAWGSWWVLIVIGSGVQPGLINRYHGLN